MFSRAKLWWNFVSGGQEKNIPKGTTRNTHSWFEEILIAWRRQVTEGWYIAKDNRVSGLAGPVAGHGVQLSLTFPHFPRYLPTLCYLSMRNFPNQFTSFSISARILKLRYVRLKCFIFEQIKLLCYSGQREWNLQKASSSRYSNRIFREIKQWIPFIQQLHLNSSSSIGTLWRSVQVLFYKKFTGGAPELSDPTYPILFNSVVLNQQTRWIKL